MILVSSFLTVALLLRLYSTIEFTRHKLNACLHSHIQVVYQWRSGSFSTLHTDKWRVLFQNYHSAFLLLFFSPSY